jgi:dihydroorotate dehydrogenase
VVYRAFFDAVFRSMDPEKAHERGFLAIRAGRPFTRRLFPATRAPRTVMGIEFPNAFGLAAGFDKNARAVPGLLALGFGHVEIGTVTARAQPGNPRPRLFRLVDDHAIVNRMGFNNDGAAVVAARLHRLRRTTAGRDAVIGVNIGKTKRTEPQDAIADYVESARLLVPHASYLVVNVSSPNTPGLRDLQAVDELRPLLTAVKDVADRAQGGRVPLLVKIAPDLADDDVDAATVEAAGAGGLSGPVLAGRATEVLVRLRARVGDELAIIAVGGVTTPDDVRARLAAGADLVQGYTGFVYEGPAWASRLAAASS